MKEIISTNLPPDLPDDFWLNLGHDQALMIYNDAVNKGIMQNNSSGHRYSPEYAKRKSNSMRRLTKGNPLYYSIKTRKGLYFKNKKAKPNKGLRTGIYKQVQVVNNNVSFVNLQLTGAMFRGLFASPELLVNEDGIKISYLPIDGGKVIGNKERGYDILGLRKENIDQSFDIVVNKLSELMGAEWEKTITIELG